MAMQPVRQIIERLMRETAESIRWAPPEEYQPHQELITKAFIALEELRDALTYKRICSHCGDVWWGLHCIHDGYQNPCPNCHTRPTPVKEDA